MKPFLICMPPVLYLLFGCSGPKQLRMSEMAGNYAPVSGDGTHASLSLRADGTFIYTDTNDRFALETSGQWQLKARKICLSSTHSVQQDNPRFIRNAGEKNTDTLVVRLSRGGHYSYELFENGKPVFSYGGDNEAVLPKFTCDSLVIRTQGHQPVGISLTRFDRDTLYVTGAVKRDSPQEFTAATWKYRAGLLRSDRNVRFQRVGLP